MYDGRNEENSNRERQKDIRMKNLLKERTEIREREKKKKKGGGGGEEEKGRKRGKKKGERKKEKGRME